jgi:hypothetical protein
VLYLYSDRESIQLDPPYQRASDIWSLDKRQLLVDSILNGYDIPKLYFHKFAKPEEIGGRRYSYAIIDGKQRLSSIWGFIDGDYPLSDAAEYLEDNDVKIAGLTYTELGSKYPRLKMRFDAYTLSVMCVETDDLELIEDMFSRLNEAVPLSAAEKRNAFGGDVPEAIRAIARRAFFSNSVPFGNKRYKHFDLATKFLLIEARDRVVDTKKAYLDAFVRDWASGHGNDLRTTRANVESVLSEMGTCFVKADALLRSVGMVTLYYHLFRIGMQQGWSKSITRTNLKEFDEKREANRRTAESDISKANYDLLEFDRYSQSPNDGYAMSIRLRILLEQVFQKELDPNYGVRGGAK